MLSTGLFNLAWWMFWALVNLLGFCAACKRAVERMTLRHCQRSRMRKLRRQAERGQQKWEPVLRPAVRPDDQRRLAMAAATA
jgi:hypothetical protein